MSTTKGCLFALLFLLFSPCFAIGPDCCKDMGGIHYCDSSASRFVCKNGYFSTCYCTRHAVMDLQLLKGCCLWQGGVMIIDDYGLVICNDGGVSAICSVQSISETHQSAAAW